jgi:hypothetical protein
MLFSDRKVKTKKATKTAKPPPAKSVGKVELKPTGIIVNPGNDQQLARCKGRLHRVNLWFEQKKKRFPRGSDQELAKQTVKRRLELQIKLLEGDF